jgi:hypothetical protein
MTPEDALEKQIEIYRRMTGEQRLKIALDLHELDLQPGPGRDSPPRPRRRRRGSRAAAAGED